VGRRTRQECEADVFAICAVLPLPLIEGRDPQELIDDGWPADMVAARVDVLTRYGF
jgi:hypothetical protein